MPNLSQCLQVGWWIGVGAVLSGSLSGCSMPSSIAAEMDRAQVRLIHLAPNSPAVDLTIAGKPAIRYVPFGMVSDYVSLPGGNYDIAVQTVGSFFDTRLDGTIASAAASLPEFRTLSILVLNESAKISAVLVDDTVMAQPDRALIRLVNGIPDAPPLLWEADQQILFTDLAFGEVSTYIPVSPGFISLALKQGIPGEVVDTSSLENNSSRELKKFEIQVEAGKVYTLYATGLLRGDPGISLVRSEEPVRFAR